MGIKDFLMRKAIQSQLKKLPPEQRELFEGLIEKNPELFTKMAQDLQNLTKQGKGQMEAMFEVMKKYQSDLQKAVEEMNKQ